MVWLWRAATVSAVGSGVGAGALPLIAVLVLRASTLDVSLLAALSAASAAAIALPFGSGIEFRAKRPVMITADLARFVALGSVPIAALLGRLSFAQLCVVGTVQTAAGIAFGAASTAHLKTLVTTEERTEVNASFATVTWVSQAGGPPMGGMLVSAVGATATMAVDAVSFLLSALGVRQMTAPEPAPPVRDGPRDLVAEIRSGWRYVFARRDLRALFANAMLFGGSVTMISPLVAVFMLRTLGLPPWEYGLALGLPCLGGILGSRLAPRLARRFGLRRVLMASGVARTPWLLLIPLAHPGTSGLAVIVAADSGLLLAAGVFNPCFVSHRMACTDDAFMARVGTAWSISSKAVQPVFIAAGGYLATVIDLRHVILLGALLCAASTVLLPWGTREPTDTVPAPAVVPAHT